VGASRRMSMANSRTSAAGFRKAVDRTPWSEL
jgi:hypothetical protein